MCQTEGLNLHLNFYIWPLLGSIGGDAAEYELLSKYDVTKLPLAYRTNTHIQTCDDLINKSSAVLLAVYDLMLPECTGTWIGAMFIRNTEKERLNPDRGWRARTATTKLRFISDTGAEDERARCNIRTNVDPELLQACRLYANMQNREMEREERHKHGGGFTYHTRAERRELSAALHEQETEEKQPPRHPQ